MTMSCVLPAMQGLTSPSVSSLVAPCTWAHVTPLHYHLCLMCRLHLHEAVGTLGNTGEGLPISADPCLSAMMYMAPFPDEVLLWGRDILCPVGMQCGLQHSNSAMSPCTVHTQYQVSNPALCPGAQDSAAILPFIDRFAHFILGCARSAVALPGVPGRAEKGFHLRGCQAQPSDNDSAATWYPQGIFRVTSLQLGAADTPGPLPSGPWGIRVAGQRRSW